MRIDPKFFNRFMIFCALITMVVIVYSTIRYTSTQQREFKENAIAKEFNSLTLPGFAGDEDLDLSSLNGNPYVIHFWSTWSGMSIDMNHHLDMLYRQSPHVTIVGAVVRDGDEQIRSYRTENPHPFHFVDGTDLFHELKATGVPTQIFINSNGEAVDVQIGRDEEKVSELFRNLVENDQ